MQLIEPWIVAIGCGACRFAHAETVRFDGPLTRLLGWPKAAAYQAILRRFKRFDRARNEAVQESVYRWFFAPVSTRKRIPLDMDSTLLTRPGGQEGATRGDNPGRRGRPSPPPWRAFVAEARRVARFWRRPGHACTSHNVLAFIESTLRPLDDKTVGLFRANSGFFDEAILSLLEGRKIDYLIRAKLTQRLQASMVRDARGWALETGRELAEITYQAQGGSAPRRIVGVRPSIKRKAAPGKTRSLLADDPDLSGGRDGARVTSLTLPDGEVWRSYRGRADGENRIKELKADFGLDSLALNSFWATEAALGFAMLAYPLIRLFRQAVLRTQVQPTLAPLHGQVLAIGASGHRDAGNHTLILSLPRKRRAWFTGLWSNSEHPPVIPVAT